jgi:hypothetical protein
MKERTPVQWAVVAVIAAIFGAGVYGHILPIVLFVLGMVLLILCWTDIIDAEENLSQEMPTFSLLCFIASGVAKYIGL